MLQLPSGEYVPDPNYYPTDLVTVKSVYGHRHRVRRAHLDDGRKIMPLFNQYGRRLKDTGNNVGATYLNRANIAMPQGCGIALTLAEILGSQKGGAPCV